MLGWFDDGATALLQAIVDAPDDLDALVFLKDAPRHRGSSGPAGSATRRRSTPSTRSAPGWATSPASETWINAGGRARRHRRAARRLRHPPPARARPRAPRLGCSCAPTSADVAWLVDLAPDGRSPPDGSRPDAPEEAGADHTLTGEPVDLYLRLWSRGASEPGRRARALVARHDLRHLVTPRRRPRSRMGAAPAARRRGRATATERSRMPHEGFGRTVQSAIYRAGAFGHRPAVPPTARSSSPRPARSCPSADSPTSQGRPGPRRAPRPTWRRSPGGGSCRGCSSTRPSATRPSSCFGRRHGARSSSRRSGCCRWPTTSADLAVARGRPRAGCHPDPQHPGVGADGGRRPQPWAARAHWFQLYWSSDDDLVESLVARAEACGSEAIVVTLDTHYLGWRPRDLDLGHLPFARGEGIAQYTSRPRLPPARRGARRAAPADAEPGAAADARPPSRTLLSHEPQPPRATPAATCAAPVPRAAVETFLDVFCRPVAHLGRPGRGCAS